MNRAVTAPAIAGSSTPLRAVHVIAGLGRAHGGPSYSVPRLCKALGECGIAISLVSVANNDGPRPNGASEGYRDIRLAQDAANIPGLGRLRFSSSLAAALRKEAFEASLIHNHGLW
ncbi:MAG: hypothetical protein ACREFW_02345, partial [Rhizomicrobium sp.]